MVEEDEETSRLIQPTYRESDPDDSDDDEFPPPRRSYSPQQSLEQIELVSPRTRTRANSHSIVSSVVSLEDDIHQTTLSFRVFLLGGLLGSTGAAVGQIFL